MEPRNLTMMTDLYQLTMMQGYLRYGMQDKRATFDAFFRERDTGSIYAVVAGLEQVVELIENLHFTEEDIAYLQSLNLFDEPFIDYLRHFHFTGDIAAMPEGTVAFPREPLVRVTAPIMEAQLVETALLNILNHQTLIATKASRVVFAAQGDSVMEFGLRRAQGPDAGIYGARAAIIGGCSGTSNVLTAQMYGGVPKGTHAHSWVMSFPTELDAFRAYANVFPDSCMLLVDTYDTLRSGVPNAITVFRELRERGYEPVGIRLDSGDMAYLSKKARQMLDDAGFSNAKIFASNDLDEYAIWDLKAQGARIDVWGVGTKLITASDNPALGGVYKLAAEEVNGEMVPRIKISENRAKITIPGVKQVYRLYEKDSGRALADLITLADEVIDEQQPLTIFDPDEPWKRMTLESFTARPLLVDIYKDGKLVYDLPTLDEISENCRQELSTLWEEYRRLNKPHVYKVDLSDKLYTLRQKLLSSQRG